MRQQLLPHAELELGARGAQREVELGPLAREVLGELAAGGLEQRVIALPAGGRAVAAGQVDGGQGAVGVGDEEQLADRGGEG